MPTVHALQPAPAVAGGPGLSPRRTAVLLALVTLVGLVLRLADLGGKSLWIDEAFSVATSRAGPAELWRTTVELDLHPPLYYALLHLWLGLGDSETSVRALSALLSALTVPVVHLVGARVAGPALGLAGSALVAVSPLQVAYAQQARMYALMTLCATGALLFVLLVLDRPSRPAPPGRRRLWWSGLVLTTTLTMLSHNTGVLLPAAVALLAGLARLADLADPAGTRSAGPRAGRSPLTGLLGVTTGLAAAVVLWLLWLPSFVAQARRVDDEFWMSSPTWATFVQHWHDLVHAAGPPALQRGAVLVAVAVLAGLGVHRLRRTPEAALLLVLLVTVPVAVELLVSLRRPVFSTQTLVWTSVPLSVLLAAGVLHLRPRPLAAAAAGAALVLDAAALSRYYADEGREDWRTATRHVAQHVTAQDLVLFDAAWAQVPFDYYYDRSGGPPVARHGLPEDVFEDDVLEARMTPAALPRLDALTRGASTVWLVLSHDWYTDPEGLVREHLASGFSEVDVRPFREVTVVRLAAGAP